MTVQDIIAQLDSLTPEERNRIKNYLLESDREEDFIETEYSDEDMEEMEKEFKDAKRGINISGPFHTAEEAVNHLKSLK